MIVWDCIEVSPFAKTDKKPSKTSYTICKTASKHDFRQVESQSAIPRVIYYFEGFVEEQFPSQSQVNSENMLKCM